MTLRAMAPTQHYAILFLLCLIPSAAVAARPASMGFTLELIHRDSPKSPLYPGNLTSTQRMKRLLDLSASRDLWLKSKIFGTMDEGNVHPRIVYDRFLFNYMVHVSFGTGKGRKGSILTFDTGSEAVWIQCEPCNDCFPHLRPIFDPTASPTWKDLACPSPLCSPPYQCLSTLCFYSKTYGDGSKVKGSMATDHLTLIDLDLSGNSKEIPNFAFGCAYLVHNWTGSIGFPDGVFGMSRAPLSFAAQTKDYINGRFSYCLPQPRVSLDTVLRFGSDIVIHGNEQSVGFLGMSRSGLYYLNLLGISVGLQRLDLPPGTFNRHPDGSGGFFIDSGSSFSKLIRPAYELVKSTLVDYFNQYHVARKDPAAIGIPLDLCYELVPGIDLTTPTMTFHFPGADLQILGGNLLIATGNAFCLAVMPSDRYSLLGAEQQQDIRFTYDLVNKELLFIRENCGANG